MYSSSFWTFANSLWHNLLWHIHIAEQLWVILARIWHYKNQGAKRPRQESYTFVMLSASTSIWHYKNRGWQISPALRLLCLFYVCHMMLTTAQARQGIVFLLVPAGLLWHGADKLEANKRTGELPGVARSAATGSELSLI